MASTVSWLPGIFRINFAHSIISMHVITWVLVKLVFNFTCVFTVLETRVKLNTNFTRPQAITYTNSQFGIFRNFLAKVEGLCKERKPKRPNPKMTESGNGRN